MTTRKAQTGLSHARQSAMLGFNPRHVDVAIISVEQARANYEAVKATADSKRDAKGAWPKALRSKVSRALQVLDQAKLQAGRS